MLAVQVAPDPSPLPWTSVPVEVCILTASMAAAAAIVTIERGSQEERVAQDVREKLAVIKATNERAKPFLVVVYCLAVLVGSIELAWYLPLVFNKLIELLKVAG